MVSAPQNLVVQIKRLARKGEKDNVAVEVPEKIDLGKSAEGGNVTYGVRAVVHHSESRSSGHYTVVCKRSYCWIKYSDQKIMYTPGPGFSETAYLIMLWKAAK
jgi:ubiquitin C-terminal hydrolase